MDVKRLRPRDVPDGNFWKHISKAAFLALGDLGNGPTLLFRRLPGVAQDLEQRRGEGAVFVLLDALEQGLKP